MTQIIDNFTGKYAFLSNFYESPFEWEERQWATAEHAFNAAKALNEKEFIHVWQAPTAREAKRRGRQVTLRPDWDKRWRYVEMFSILQAKFSDTLLTAQLAGTGDAILVEGNTWHDNVWGVCRCAKCSRTGRNMLGIFLMLVRDAR